MDYFNFTEPEIKINYTRNTGKFKPVAQQLFVDPKENYLFSSETVVELNKKTSNDIQ